MNSMSRSPEIATCRQTRAQTGNAAANDPRRARTHPGDRGRRATAGVENARGGATAPAQLATLAETARDYAGSLEFGEHAKSPTLPTGGTIQAWTRRHGLPALPPDPRFWASMSPPAPPGRSRGKPCSVRTIERRLRRWRRISPSAGKLTAPTATSPPSSPASAPRGGRRTERSRSCPKISWR